MLISQTLTFHISATKCLIEIKFSVLESADQGLQHIPLYRKSKFWRSQPRYLKYAQRIPNKLNMIWSLVYSGWVNNTPLPYHYVNIIEINFFSPFLEAHAEALFVILIIKYLLYDKFSVYILTIQMSHSEVLHFPSLIWKIPKKKFNETLLLWKFVHIFEKQLVGLLHFQQNS